MFRLNKETNVLSIIAKDTADFAISLDNYVLDDGDVVFFTVNDKLENPDFKIQKRISTFVNHQAIINLTSKDTDLPAGDYYYDIEVDTADGRVDTVLGPYKFRVLGGVKY